MVKGIANLILDLQFLFLLCGLDKLPLWNTLIRSILPPILNLLESSLIIVLNIWISSKQINVHTHKHDVLLMTKLELSHMPVWTNFAPLEILLSVNCILVYIRGWFRTIDGMSTVNNTAETIINKLLLFNCITCKSGDLLCKSSLLRWLLKN